MDKQNYSVKEAAAILGVSIQTLRRWDKSGKLKPDFVTPGRHRRYSKDLLARFSIDIFSVGRRWAEASVPTDLLSASHCGNSGVFQIRLSTLQREFQLHGLPESLFLLLVAIIGEIGNNSFDHNLGNWPDVPGVYFAYDLARRQVVLADRGVGILTTLKRVRPKLQSDAEALHVAFTEVVSGRAPEPRGNGLKFVASVLRSSPINLQFQTGSAVLSFEGGKPPIMHTADGYVRGTFVTLSYTL